MMSIGDGSLPIGSIIIAYQLNGDGEPAVITTFPDTEDVPMITQLGMLELARITLMHEATGGDDQ